MEIENYTAYETLKNEYLAFILKYAIGKNTIERPEEDYAF